MGIVGIGTDLVQIHRIETLWQQFGEKFAHRILADEEWDDFKAAHFPVPFLAKRFAAKEAVSKALGTGMGTFLAFKEVCVYHTPEGKPLIKLLGKAKDLLDPACHIHITISDERDLAIAFAVIEKDKL